MNTMLTSRIMLRRHASFLKCRYTSARHFSQPAEESDELSIHLDLKLAPLPAKKPKREPFAKNFFIGKFDNEVMAYPEVQTNERQKHFAEWLAPIENCIDRNFDPAKIGENLLPFEAVEELREMGVFRATLSLEHRGFDLTATEYAKLFEILGKNPSLTTYVASRSDPIQILVKYGSEEQKKKYLPKFMNGDLIPTFATIDNTSEKWTSVSNANAVISKCRNFWKINGEKKFVTNGNQANCFFLLANFTEIEDPYLIAQTPTLIIVEREHGGITSTDTLDKLGQRSVETCSVEFKNTLVPKENLIGEIGSAPDILLELLMLGKYNTGSQAATILRRFLNTLTQHAIEQKIYDQPLMTTDLAQEIIGKMTATLYTIESMIYLTTGLVDQFEEQDINLENAIVEAYSARECVKQLYEGLKLIGKQAYLKDSPFERIYRDALAMNLFNSNDTELCMYIAIMGLHHKGIHSGDMVNKYRNPFMFPKAIFKEMFELSKGPDLAIEEHLHPTLIVSAKLLGDSVNRLVVSADTMLIRHGNKVVEAHMELNRLSEMAMDIYAMAAVLARSSRSYCIGLRHSMDDIYIAHTVCFNAQKRVQKYSEEIEAGEEANCDDIYRKLARRVIEQKGYFPEHPLKKNY